MKDTVAQEILREHLVEGKLEKGAQIGLSIDQTLTQYATETMVYLEFESPGLDTVKCSFQPGKKSDAQCTSKPNKKGPAI